MERQQEVGLSRPRLWILAGFLCLLPTLLFYLAFLLKRNGIGHAVRMFLVFDQLLFDADDFLILVCVPFLVVVLSTAVILRQRTNDQLLAVLAVSAALVVAANVTGYLITDPIYEARRQSLYE